VRTLWNLLTEWCRDVFSVCTFVKLSSLIIATHCTVVLYQWGIDVKTYSPGGAKAVAAYDAASNCLIWLINQNI